MTIGDSVVETLVKPGGLLVRNYNPTQFPKSTSSFTNLSRSVIPNASNYSKCRILSKVTVLELYSDSIIYFYFPQKIRMSVCLQNVL